MKKIQLTKGYSTIIDDEFFEFLNQWKWHYSDGYALRKNYSHKQEEPINVRMHRVIMGLKNKPNGVLVDHKNRNRLDNRIANLRICSKSDNGRNGPKHRGNTSGFKGVTFHPGTKKWRAMISINGKTEHIGLFKNINDAKKAFDKVAKIEHGEFFYQY